MAIRTFSAQDRYWEGGTETKRKVKKVRSIKVANLERLRLSMRRREKSQFNRGVMASLDDVTDPSESSSSAGISGTSSPNYMKATTSSSARKGRLQVSSGSPLSSSASSSIDSRTSGRQDNPVSSVKSASKFSKVAVQECSDPAGVNIPVTVKQEKRLKRVPSLKQAKKLTSKKSMKIRDKYSQFQDLGISQNEMLDFGMGFQSNTRINGGGMEIVSESSKVSNSQGQDIVVKTGAQQRRLERSRSRKLTRLRSIRSSRARQRQQSRLSGGAAEFMLQEGEELNSGPHYMKGTSSQESKTNSDKILTRTSSLRPLRILAKIPSLRSKRNKPRKRPQASSLAGASVDRATCSSTLKRTEVPEDIELLRDRELEKAPLLHVCPYSYCSIHGNRRHAHSQPTKEFISAKRRLFSNQRGVKNKSRFTGETEHHATESDHLRQRVPAENYAVQEVMDATTENAPELEDNGIDSLNVVYTKPRKMWSAVGMQSKDTEALHHCTYDQISVDEEKLEEAQSETSVSEDVQGALNDDWEEKHEIFKQHQNSNIAALSLPLDPSQYSHRDSADSPDGRLINIFSNKQKYTSMWQLIHQQLLSSEASMNEAQVAIQADETIGDDGITTREMHNLDPKSDNSLNVGVADQITANEKHESHQTEAIKLVQEALNAILQSDAESYQQQSNASEGLADESLRVRVSTPTVSTEESLKDGVGLDGKVTSLASVESKHKIKQIGNNLLRKEPDGQEMSERRMSKSLSKLRKMIVTAKFIKAMERLKKINPRRPQYLSADPASENEKVNLRHLSMNEKKDTEEWMLDNALRQVITRLDPDQQRRVAKLVEAFETVTPEQKEKNSRHHPVKSVHAAGRKLADSTKGEREQIVEPEQDISLSDRQVVQQQYEAQHFLKSFPEEQCFSEEHEYQKIATGDKTVHEGDETNMSNSTLVTSEKSSQSKFSDSAFDDRGEELNVASQLPDTEVRVANDMPTIFSNKQKYKSMWNMIYKHVVSSEASINENQGINGIDKLGETNNCQEMNDKDSTLSDYSSDQNEGDDNQSSECEKPELDQSAAIKLVKEALSAILKRHEKPSQSQSIPNDYRAPEDGKDLYNSKTTSCIEENPVEGDKQVEKENHTNLDIKDKLHHVNNKNLPLQQQVECGEMEAPQRKMSKSLSKLKKAFATARFIKAMERLTKGSPRKSQNPSLATTSKEERVYLRHRSMSGKIKGEEWMLDYALRQVLSKMDPDQQRRVEGLVEAFEKVQPGQKEGIRCHSFKEEDADGLGLNTSMNEANSCSLKSQQQRSESIEKVPQNQNNGDLPPTRDASLEISLEEHRDQQVSSSETVTQDASQRRSQQKDNDQPMSLADDVILQETDKTAISESTSLMSGDGPNSASVVIKLEEPGGRAIPAVNSLVMPRDNTATILLKKHNYTSMWHLIHQHVLSNEASTIGKKEVHEIDEGEHINDSNTCQPIDDPDSTQTTQLKKFKADEENHSAAFDQSAAVSLVKEAVNAILQSHEQDSDRQSLQEHGIAASKAGDTCDTEALGSTREDYEGMREGKQRDTKPEEELQEIDVKGPQIQPQAEANEAKISQRTLSTSFSKLRKAIATAKFIKAMERLRKINPRKPRHLSAEVASEEERVQLRHLSINDRKNDEEWMLDYALRKVLSDLAPDQQRKVALIVEAFETVHPGQKGRHVARSEWDLDIQTKSTTDKKQFLKSKHDSLMSSDDDIPPLHTESLDVLDKVATSEESKQDSHSLEFPNLKTEISHTIPDSEDSNLHIHHQVHSKGSPIDIPMISTDGKGEINAKLMHEPLQHASDPEQDNSTSITEGMNFEKQKNTSMWHLIYQHVKFASDTEVGSKLSERLNNGDQMNRCSASSEMIADADSDDSDASSTTSELTESDATKLVREAINKILNAPEHPVDELSSSNEIAISGEDQRASFEDIPKKSLSKGYSKLRKLIICNKFIKAMEKTEKSHPQKQSSPALNSDSGAGKVHLKNHAAGERKGMSEWMLDNVLQKVIAGLAPVQQNRVALLVEAFEKVHPEVAEKGNGVLLDATSSKRDAKEKKDTVSSTNSKYPDDLDLKQNKTTSTREVTAERVAHEIAPGLTREYSSNMGNWKSDGPCNTTASTSDKDPTKIDVSTSPSVPLEETIESRDGASAQLEEGTSTDEHQAGNNEQAPIFVKKPPQPVDMKDECDHNAHKDRSLEGSSSLWGLLLQQVTTDMLDRTETPEAEIDAHPEKESTSNEASAQLEQGTSTDEQLVGNTEQSPVFVKKPSHPANMKDEWNYSAHKDRSSEKSTSLWGLILQQVTTDMLESSETPECEIDAEPQKESTKMLENRADESAQVSSKTKSSRDMGVQTPTSFEFQENEAIRVVEEAVEEILLLQDQIKDTELMTSNTNLEQAVHSPENGYVREPSTDATETADVATTLHSVATPEEEKISSKENSPSSYSTLSKVILCKRFVKAMGKMRKLKAMSAQNSSQPPHTEEKGNPSLRQISTNDKTSWEEGMLDNALQKVIGNLAPAKKQRVALLVQAFETVGSQPEATNSWRGKALVS